jgi:hypothetical protein
MSTHQLVFQSWEGGHSAGCTFSNQAGYCYIYIRVPEIRESFGYFDETTKEAVLARADKRRAELSLQHGLTKNLYRKVSNPTTGDAWLEVQLTRGQVMECEIEHLPFLQRCVWNAKKSKRGRTYYAVTMNGSKMIYFHRLVTGFNMVDHKDKVGLHNRRSNLIETTMILNARNRGPTKSNKTGVVGVYISRAGYVVATWPSPNGKSSGRHFSIKKLGYDGAFESAVKFRKEKEKELGITPEAYIAPLPVVEVTLRQKAFTCPLCEKKMAYKYSLERHLQLKHPLDGVKEEIISL